MDTPNVWNASSLSSQKILISFGREAVNIQGLQVALANNIFAIEINNNTDELLVSVTSACWGEVLRRSLDTICAMSSPS